MIKKVLTYLFLTIGIYQISSPLSACPVDPEQAQQRLVRSTQGLFSPLSDDMLSLVVKRTGIMIYAKKIGSCTKKGNRAWKNFLSTRTVATKASSITLYNVETLKRPQKLIFFVDRADNSIMENIGKLRNLRDLNLCFTNITGKGLVHLRGLTQLNQLLLGWEKFERVELKHLRRLTSLEKLSLGNAWFNNSELRSLTGLTNLQHLIMCSPRICQKDLLPLTCLTKLQSLQLYSERVDTAVGLNQFFNRFQQ